MNHFRNKQIYLAGAMESLGDAGLNWRLEYEKDLKKLGFKCIIPEREEKNVTNQQELNKLKQDNLDAYIGIMRKLIDLDLNFILDSGLVVVYWNGERMSGTIHEVGYAYEAGIPSYLVTPKPFKEVPGWFLSCFTERFHTKEELLTHLNGLKILR